MKWIGFNELGDTGIIEKFESDNGVLLPTKYKEIAKQYNGGTPSANSIRISSNQVTDVKLLLSFKEGDAETIFSAFPFFSKKGLIPFATDSAGNYFCFSKEKVVFWEHEEDEVTNITQNFLSFLEMLH